MEIVDNFLENHQEKCRCCFKSFRQSEERLRITKIIESQFLELTQLRLRTSNKKYSQNICRTCCNDLTECSIIRNNFLQRQKKLYELVDGKIVKRGRKPAHRDDSTHEVAVKLEIKQELDEFETENCIVIEPVIKTENVKEHEETHDGFWPLDHLYESNEHVKLKDQESDSSEGPFDKFFNSKTRKYKKKIKKPKSKTEKRSITWHNCSYCSKRFYTETTLQVHIDSYHFNFKNFKCDHCDFKTHKPGLLKGHVARVHDRTQVIPSSKDGPKNPCPHCGLLVQKVSAHIRNVHTRPKNVFCDICGFGIFNLNRLRRHMYKHLSKETKHELISFGCDLCGASLHSKNSIKSHMKNIHLESGENDHKCFCGRSYKAESYLKIHQKTHEKTAKHQCSQCEKRFMNPSQLKIHMEIHERKGRKDYSCETCGGMYGSMNLLMRHKIFHTEPKHSCQYCGKKFHRPCLVERHVKRQHEVQEVPCQFCGKMLNSLSMTRHVKEFHSGLPRLNCPVTGCNGMYLRRFHLKDHMQRTHKDFLNCLTVEERNALEEKINQMNLI